LLYDPQTSGGLLITLPENDAAALVASLDAAYRIGQVLPRGQKAIRVT
jgi:selenophosphate synthase